MIFKTELIDSKWNKKWLDRLAIILAILFLPLMVNKIFKFWNNESPIPELLMLIVYIFYIYYSLKRRKYYNTIGEIEFNNDGLVVLSKNKSMIYNWGVLKHIQIIRGCRIPSWDNIPNYAHSNYVRFFFKDSSFEFEFSINTQKDHANFEAMIQSLFDQDVKLDYKSI